MNKLNKIINAEKRAFKKMNECTDNDSYVAENKNYTVARSRLTKLANKIGEMAWDKMLSETEHQGTSYRWFNYRDYMVKQLN
jgi:gamma-glutamyltranspeptidase